MSENPYIDKYDLRYDGRCDVFYICESLTGQVVVQEIADHEIAELVVAGMNFMHKTRG